jgi:hypothetical protein
VGCGIWGWGGNRNCVVMLCCERRGQGVGNETGGLQSEGGSNIDHWLFVLFFMGDIATICGWVPC